MVHGSMIRLLGTSKRKQQADSLPYRDFRVKAVHKILPVVGIVLLALLIVAVISGEWYVRGLGPRARKRVIANLSERFDANVKLANLELSLLPTPHVIGSGLEIWRRSHPTKQPFLRIARFTANANASDLLHERDHVEQVELEGLQIDIPRRGDEVEVSPAASRNSPGSNALRVRIDTLVANGAVLQIEPASADKDPLRYEITKLTMHSVGAGQPLTFVTMLHNAKPPGLIDSSGSFGPWQHDDLRATPVKGKYSFSKADLAVFSGISGTLASSGSYVGHLESITVDGTTDVPNFALKRGGAPVHLMTSFHAFVDGTNGDTKLDPVSAHFLNSTFVCRGGITELRPHTGKTVDLEASTTTARMQDVLTLISGDQRPLLDGPIRFHSHIVIPPGNRDVLEKLLLRGRFKIDSGTFTDPKVEHRLGTLSDRAQGITKKEEGGQAPHLAASKLSADFSLRNGVAQFPDLIFGVPGASIRLAGSYNLESQQVDMKGFFRMQATLAQTQSGVKHWVLVPFDRFFEKDGAGFQVPLAVSGTREEPEISVIAFHHKFRLK